jgi:hypothetical protein
LPPIDFELLKPLLKLVQLDQKAILVEQGDLLPKLYFPLSAVVSFVLVLSTGLEVETAMVGRDGVVGSLVKSGRR